MPPIRFAILAGVSTDPQAHEDKMSIPAQVENCRKLIAANGGAEACGPYIMDGYSRTGYDSLDAAMNDIPPLGQAVNDAMQDKYDILVMDHFDRLGDIGLIALIRFKKIRKQLYSVRQSGRVILPEEYNPYADEHTGMQMHMQGVVQDYRINKIRRAWETGVPDRAAAGLHPLCTSYGYKPGLKSEPATPIPEEIKLVIEMKDMFLRGDTLQDICTHADRSGIKPRRASTWKINVVKRIILSRFYAGYTIFGKYKTVNGKRIPQPQSQWTIGKGRHKPLWDDATYQAILAEAERRDSLRSRSKVYALTGLLTCSVCGQRLYRHGKLNSKYQVVLGCHSSPQHVVVEYRFIIKWVAKLIVEELKAGKHKTHLAPEDLSHFDQQLAQLAERRTKVQQGYEINLYTASEANTRIVAIETESEKLIAQRDRAAQRSVHQQALLQFAEQDLEKMQKWILEDDPTTVNRLLTALCETITITPSYQMNIIWR